MTEEKLKAMDRQAFNRAACNCMVGTLRNLNLREPIKKIIYGEFDDGAYVRIIYKAHYEYTIDTDKDTIAMLTDIINYLIEYEGNADLKKNPVWGEYPIESDLCNTLGFTKEGKNLSNMALWYAKEGSRMNLQFDDSDDWKTAPVSEDGLLMIRDVIDYIAKEGPKHGKHGRQTEDM